VWKKRRQQISHAQNLRRARLTLKLTQRLQSNKTPPHNWLIEMLVRLFAVSYAHNSELITHYTSDALVAALPSDYGFAVVTLNHFR
jgi:hypothetical protein